MSRELTFFYDILLEFNEKVSDHAFTLRCLSHSRGSAYSTSVCLYIRLYRIHCKKTASAISCR